MIHVQRQEVQNEWDNQLVHELLIWVAKIIAVIFGWLRPFTSICILCCRSEFEEEMRELYSEFLSLHLMEKVQNKFCSLCSVFLFQYAAEFCQSVSLHLWKLPSHFYEFCYIMHQMWLSLWLKSFNSISGILLSFTNLAFLMLASSTTHPVKCCFASDRFHNSMLSCH